MPLGVLLTIPVGLAVRAARAAHARREPRHRHPRPRLHDPGGRVHQGATGSAKAFDGGTRIGTAELFGIARRRRPRIRTGGRSCASSGSCSPALVVANLRRSRTGRRLIAVRTNERAAASLGISVFGVKLYAFSVAAAIAGLAGILYGFQRDGHHLRAVQPVPVDLQRRLGGHRRPRVRRSARCSRRPTRSAGSARASSKTCSRSASGTRLVGGVILLLDHRRSTRTASPRSWRTASDRCCRSCGSCDATRRRRHCPNVRSPRRSRRRRSRSSTSRCASAVSSRSTT